MFKRNFFVIIILTIIFSIIIFFIKMYFFSGIEKSIEEEYIDRSILMNLDSSKKEDTNKTIVVDNIKNNQSTTNLTGTVLKETEKKKIINYKFTYIPKDFESGSLLQTNILKKIVVSLPFYEIVKNLGIDLYKDTFEVRGKMKNGKVKLFGITHIDNSELVAVFIHELGHFVDIYSLNGDNDQNVDPSHYFYDIAWESTKTIKSSMLSTDFVSGYAMTNKYEDFAETFAYYVLHNSDFKEKTTKSNVLKSKYKYFGRYLFKNKEFTTIDFGEKEEIKDYYWDITKISINLEKFLQYFKNSI